MRILIGYDGSEHEGAALDDLKRAGLPHDLDLSDRLEDDALALSYLYLRDEYGAGRLLTDAAMQA
jgi:hypothetical protein